MPGYLPPRGDSEKSAEEVPLRLPSSFNSSDREIWCRVDVIEAEVLVRLASMSSSLEDLIRSLTTRTFVYRFKVKNITGRRAHTRAQDGLTTVGRAVDAAAGAYHRHHTAYKSLGAGSKGWEKLYRLLTSADVRGLSEKALSEQELQDCYRATELAKALATVVRSSDKSAASTTMKDVEDELEEEEEEEEDNGVPVEMFEPRETAAALAPGEGRRRVPWIWAVGLQTNGDQQLTDGKCMVRYTKLCVCTDARPALCVEWSRAKARSERWAEEVILTTEEMRRNLAYCVYARNRWVELAQCQTHEDPAVARGKVAYALKQVAYEVKLADSLAEKWKPVLLRASLSLLLRDWIIDVLGALDEC
jgi:hypothetical protein